MLAEPRVLARNTSFFTLALVGQKVISFLYFTYLSKIFGPDDLGRYVLAISLAMIFGVLLDAGLAPVLTRETAREPTQAEHYTRLIIGFKIVTCVLVVALLYGAAWLLGYSPTILKLIYVAGAVMVLDSFVLTAYSAIRGFHNLIWESWGSVATQAVVAGLGFIISHYTHNTFYFMLSLAVAALAHVVYALSRLKFVYKIRLWPEFSNKDFKKIALLAWPFALAAVLTKIFGYADSVLLSVLANERAVGMYSVAYKITFALQFIPTAFAASLYPGFSAYVKNEPAKLANTFINSIRYLTAIAVPISFGLVVLAPQILGAVYPKFSESVAPLQILILSLPFLFVTFPIGSLLPACNLQKRNTLNLGLAAGVNIIVNLLLIPELGPIGAAVASLASTITLLILGFVVARKLVAIDIKLLTISLLKIILAGLIMAVVAWYALAFVNFIVVILLSAVVYIIVLMFMGGLSWAEIKSWWQLLTARQN